MSYGAPEIKCVVFLCDSSHGDPGQPQQSRGQRCADLRVCGPGILQGGNDAPHPA